MSTTFTASTSNTSTYVNWRVHRQRVYVAPPQDPSAERIREAIRADASDYLVLGCQPGDPPEKVRREWRRLAKIHHPDHGGERERFEEIRAAYARLRRQGRG